MLVNETKKTASILKNFYYLIYTFSILGLFTIFYLKAIQPNLVKKELLITKL